MFQEIRKSDELRQAIEDVEQEMKNEEVRSKNEDSEMFLRPKENRRQRNGSRPSFDAMTCFQSPESNSTRTLQRSNLEEIR